MRRFIISSTLLLISAFSNAQSRTEQDCADIARAFLTGTATGQNRIKAEQSVVADNVKMVCNSSTLLAGETDTPEASFYVYAHNNGAPGFVIVSAKEGSQQILGFSYDDNFSGDKLNQASRSLLLSYANGVNDGALQNKNIGKVRSNTMDIPSDVEPLLGNIKYNQRDPYNRYCPMWGENQCILGCVPVTMASLMRYYRYPDRMNSSHGDISYSTSHFPELTWSTSNVSFDWDNILDNYKGLMDDAISEVKQSTDKVMSITSASLSEYDGYISLNTLKNASGKTFAGYVRFIIADANGKMLGFGSTPSSISELKSGWYYNSYSIAPTISQSLPDGTYRMYVGTKTTNSDSWSLARKDNEPFYFEVTKSGSSITAFGESFSDICAYTTKQGEAVAKLCGSCAYSAHANFGTGSTSTKNNDMLDAMCTYFGFNDQAYFVSSNEATTDTWHRLLQQTLAEETPIKMSGNSGFNGHSFIIDGFKYVEGLPYYHVNWGWGGSDNGYYLITNLTPNSKHDGGAVVNYAEELTAYLDLKPQTVEHHSHQFTATGLSLSNFTVKDGTTVSFKIAHLKNSSATTAPANTSAYLFLVGADGKEYNMGEAFKLQSGLQMNHYYKECSGKATIKDLPVDGEYTFDLRIKDPDASDYRSIILPADAAISVYGTVAIDAVEADAANPSGKLYDLSGKQISSPSDARIVIQNNTKYLNR